MTTQTKHNQKCVKRGKAWVNAGDQVVFGFRFASDWFKKRRKFFGPIKKRSKAKPRKFQTTFATQFKIAPR